LLKEDKQLINKLQPKPCPNCREPNKPDVQSCWKCGFIMSFQAYQKEKEEREKKDHEIHELKEQVEEIRDLYQGLIKTLNEAVVLRGKIEANPQEFLEADPFKFAANQKRRYNAEAHA
jgi:hypothetical protein